MSQRILIADDDRVTSTVLCAVLRGGGYETLTAADGIEAVQQFFAHYPDLVLLDLQMPRLKGDVVIQLLRDHPDARSVPIILLTADDDRSSEFWALTTGADAFLNKSKVRDELRPLVTKTLAEHPSRDVAPAPLELTAVEILARVGELLDRKLFISTLRRQIFDISSTVTDFDSTVIKLFEKLAAISALEAGCLALIDREPLLYCDGPAGAALTESVLAQLGLASGSARVLGADTDDERAAAPPLDQQQATEFFAVRLQARGQPIGSLALAASGGQLLGTRGRDAIRAMARAIGLVVDNARLLTDLADKQQQIEADLDVARQIQGQMLQLRPLPAGVNIAVGATHEPAKGVGGDYFHVAQHDGVIWMMIGDVAGKGVSAALIVSTIHTIVCELLPRATSPLEVIAELNAHVHANYRHASRFMSFALMAYHPQDRVLDVGGAGHEAMLIYRAKHGGIQQIPTGGMVLGVTASIDRHPNNTNTLRLDPGDKLLLYSDGVTEAVNRVGAMYGLERLHESFGELAGQHGAQPLVDALRARVNKFAAGAEPADDLTLLALEGL